MRISARCRAGAAALVLLGAAAAAAVAVPPPGRLLAAQCAQCHGTNGLALGDMVSLAGKNESEIYREVLRMQAHPQPKEIMHRQAAGYSEAQIRLIAQYFAGLPAARQRPSSYN